MRIFIAGCARSGTSLARSLMKSFSDLYVFDSEARVEKFDELARSRPESHLVVKRTATAWRTLAELRMNRVAPDTLVALGTMGRDLQALATRLERELHDAGLADRAMIFEAATAAVQSNPPPLPAGLPLLLLDVSVITTLETALVAALAAAAGDVMATLPAGDARSLEQLEAALGCTAGVPGSPKRRTALGSLKARAEVLGFLDGLASLPVQSPTKSRG